MEFGLLVMAALWNRAGHYIFILWFLMVVWRKYPPLIFYLLY